MAALAATGLWLGLLATIAFDPRAIGCFACPRNLLHTRIAGNAPDQCSGC